MRLVEQPSLEDGEPFEREDLSACLADRPTALDAVRYIVPRQAVPEEYRLWAADRVLMPLVEAEVGAVEEMVLQRPLKLSDDDAWRTALASHAITIAMLLLLTNIVGFLKARQEELQQQLATFLQRMCEWAVENTPPLTELLVEDLDESA